MPDGHQMVKITNQELQTMRFDEALEYYAPDLETALPGHIPLDRFKRVVLTAVNQNPDLARADRRSLFNSCSRCAHDGLYPDGREAALAVFRTKVKRKVPNDNGDLVEREFYADLVQYLPMVAGIRKRMRNTGEVLSADAQIVCRADKFHYEQGDDPKIEHEPAPLAIDRGETIGAYAIIKLANGEVLREVMSRRQIEWVRQMSRSKDGPAWTKSWDEMARKTVLKRCAKAAPTVAELERLLGRDEEFDRPDRHTPMREIPARPDPKDYVLSEDELAEGEIEQSDEASRFDVVDFVGESHEYVNETEAEGALIEWLGEMRSLQALDGLMESNSTWAQRPQVIAAYKAQKEVLILTHEHPEGASHSAEPSTPDERRQTQELPAAASATHTAATAEKHSRDDSAALVVPVRKPVGKSADWKGTADDMGKKIETLTALDELAATGRFVQANRSTLDNMRVADKATWGRVMYQLGERERQVRSGESGPQ